MADSVDRPPGRRERKAKPGARQRRPAGTGRPSRRAIRIVNPKARGAAAMLDAALEVLAGAGLKVTVATARTPAEAEKALAAEGKAAGIVIVGGGDGTLSHLAGALLRLGKPVGVLPLGTANDFARGLGLPTDIVEAARVIAAGHLQAVDVGFLDGQPFLNVAHIGLGANVARRHKGRLKRLLGVAAYPLHWIAAYRATRPVKVSIHTEEESREIVCAQLAVGPGRHYGSGLTLAEDAHPGDGLLRLYAVEPRSAAGWATLIPALKRGSVGAAAGTLALTGTRFRIEPRRKLKVNVDGDLDGTFPATITIRPGALKVFAPPEEKGP
jgi:YegS/Rv2252/BmrU family lipid kinase